MSNSIRVAYGETLLKLCKENDKIVVLDADLASATQTKLIQNEMPDRFYNFGIAEQNLIGAAAGFAYQGFIPFASTFAMFGTGRAFEIIRNQIAYANLNVKLAFTHAGITVGEDGGSHQTVEDIALMRCIPNMVIVVPCDPNETEKAIKEALKYNGPVYLRLARPNVENITDINDKFEIGKANVLLDGNDVCIITCGLMTSICLNAARKLNDIGISTAVINMHTIKPFDKSTLNKFNKCRLFVSVEEHSIIGGLGSAVSESIDFSNAPLEKIGIEDIFGRSGDYKSLLNLYGLCEENIINRVKKYFK